MVSNFDEETRRYKLTVMPNTKSGKLRVADVLYNRDFGNIKFHHDGFCIVDKLVSPSEFVNSGVSVDVSVASESDISRYETFISNMSLDESHQVQVNRTSAKQHTEVDTKTSISKRQLLISYKSFVKSGSL